ncbi:MAG: bifunctional (p)ppGpp synthetase/guanosine-3',5'-bis(diphosphate) 3'-pyrophosphohydrolase [Acidobacteria bacterium]|nr:bifunctional (p)ppGpp synthetase/guanosine-3',5'-bis(diphosphate) 3'-pyrophosphohydrolase [Candidatus Sulfomarinibacter kjeldsenii]
MQAQGVATAQVEVKVRIEDILNRMERYRPELDEDLLRHAYVFAANRHQGQIRRSGEPYLTHPLTVAWILADMELDEETVAAGLRLPIASVSAASR